MASRPILRLRVYVCRGGQSVGVNKMAGSLFRQAGKVVLAILFLTVLHTHGITAQERAAIQTIVFIRHAEKPKGGFGQLTCQGLNRALALAPMIAQSFGKPDAIFAPNPSHRCKYTWGGQSPIVQEPGQLFLGRAS